MDVLTIQWGWVGGKSGVIPPIPTAPAIAGGAIDPYLLREEWLRNRRKIDRMRILYEEDEFLVLID